MKNVSILKFFLSKDKLESQVIEHMKRITLIYIFLYKQPLLVQQIDQY